MADVWVARINRYVEKLFNIKGGPSLVDLDAGLQVSLPIKVGVEEASLQGINRFGATVIVASNPANSGGVMLHNPPSSGVVAVLERIACRNTVTTLSTMSVTFASGPAAIADYGTINTAIRLDGRINTGSSLILSSSQGAVGFANVLMQPTVLNGLETSLIVQADHEIVLTPASAIQVVDLTVNEGVVISYIWRERAIETSESS